MRPELFLVSTTNSTSLARSRRVFCSQAKFRSPLAEAVGKERGQASARPAGPCTTAPPSGGCWGGRSSGRSDPRCAGIPIGIRMSTASSGGVHVLSRVTVVSMNEASPVVGSTPRSPLGALQEHVWNLVSFKPRRVRGVAEGQGGVDHGQRDAETPPRKASGDVVPLEMHQIPVQPTLDSQTDQGGEDEQLHCVGSRVASGSRWLLPEDSKAYRIRLASYLCAEEFNWQPWVKKGYEQKRNRKLHNVPMWTLRDQWLQSSSQ